MNQHKTSMKSYRKWGEPTIYNGYVMDVKCFFVEDMEKFINLSGDKRPLCGIGSIAVEPSTGEIYYLSYENGWKLWGGESGSDSGGDVIAIDFKKTSEYVTLQKTWREIKDLFDSGAKLAIGTELVDDVLTVGNSYNVRANEGLYVYTTDSEDGYPRRKNEEPK